MVDWKPRDGDFTEVVALLFDGGTLTARDIDRIVVEPSEVRGYRFVELDEAATLLDAELFERVAAGLAVRATGRTAYLENGVPPFADKLNPFDDRSTSTGSGTIAVSHGALSDRRAEVAQGDRRAEVAQGDRDPGTWRDVVVVSQAALNHP